MSDKKDSNLPADIDPKLVEGWTMKEIMILSEFKKDGLPGITKFTEETIKKAKEGYLNGKSFSMISMELRVPKSVITYYAYRDRWQPERSERVSAIMESLSSQAPIMQLDNALFVTEMADFFKKYFRERIETYEKTKDEQVIANIDWKLFANFTKLLDLIKGNSATPPSPPVNITANEVAINMKGGQNEQDENLGNVLRALADINRSKDVK